MTYQQMRAARLSSPIYCPCGAAHAVRASDYCPACSAKNAAAKRRIRRAARKQICLRLALIAFLALPFSIAVGIYCPAFLQPLVILVGLLAAIPLAAMILGGRSENA